MKKNRASKQLNAPVSRKKIRKQMRQEKKIKRKEHYVKAKVLQEKPSFTPGAFVKRPAEALNEDIDVKKKKKKNQLSAQDLLAKEREKELKEANKLKSQMESQRRTMLLKDIEDEDKMIKKLEKQLGLNKAKNKNKSFAEDGLDYLLEICDRSTTEQIVAAEKHLAAVEDESDFEEDVAAVTGKKVVKEKKKKEEQRNNDSEDDGDLSHIEDEDLSGDDFDDVEDDDDSDLSADDQSDQSSDGISDQSEDEPPRKKSHKESKSEPVKYTTKKNFENKSNDIESDNEVISNPFSDDEVSHLSNDGDDIDDDDNEEDNKKCDEKPDVWEDIYGRKRDKEGNIIKEEKGAYVPPHLRNKNSAGDENLEALTRQIKSILNKLTGANLHWACSSVERLYSSHSRHAVNTALYQQWAFGGLGREMAPSRLLVELASLLAVLRANVSDDVGAYFLQTLVNKFDELLENPGPMEDKQLDNVVACLSNLYNFKIYHSSLLYDILNRLLENLTEKNIECILIALRVVGGTLRKDDPTALKEFIQETQRRIAEVQEKAASGSRVKFLLEVLMAIKNNNLTKIPNYDPTYTEQLKKSLKAIIRKGNYVTPLNIRLDDLLKADERGKWWVVGSAWEGNLTKSKSETKPVVDQKLLELARKQRMNTDVRRSIFCVIMGAEDYMDAFEKLQHLGLKGQQEREIIHVLLACCLQEKSYNPYYSLLAKQMARSDRRIQLSIQYSIWDKIKDLENVEKHSASNLAQLLTHLIMEGTLPLSVLKVIEFSDLNKSTVRFMRQILLAIILNVDLESSLQVFQRISSSNKLHMFRESLRLFIQHFLVRNAGKSTLLSATEMEKLKERTVQVDKLLTMHDSKISF